MAKVVLMGAGKVCEYLIHLLLAQDKNIDIHIIEVDSELCEDLANHYPVQVFRGNGTSLSVLEAAGVHDCDIFAALTGQDEKNLIACQMAERCLACRRTIARVVDPRNLKTFHELGIRNTFSSTLLLSELLNTEIRYRGMSIPYDIPGTSKLIVDFELSEKSPVCGKALMDYRFPMEARVVLITRPNADVETPIGSSVLHAGDRIMLLCDETDLETIYSCFVNPNHEAHS